MSHRPRSSKKSKRQRAPVARNSGSKMDTSPPETNALSRTSQVSPSPPEDRQSQSTTGENSRTPPDSSSFKRSLHLYCIFTGLLLAIVGIVLNALGKLPTPIAAIAGNLGTLLALIAALWGHIERFFVKIWQEAHRVRVLFLSVVTAFLLIGGTFVYSNPAIIRSPFSGHSGPSLTSLTASLAHPKAMTTAVATATIQHLVPLCSNAADGTEWDTPLTGTILSCPHQGQGLLMQQNSSANYAALELRKVDGKSYQLSTFHMQVDVLFQRPVDPDTWVGLAFSALQTGDGENFELALNAEGIWRLTIEGVGSSIVGTLPINLSQPITLTVLVKTVTSSSSQSTILECLINQQFIASYDVAPDELITLIRLRVEQPDNSVSSPVLYSNFNLTTQGGTQ